MTVSKQGGGIENIKVRMGKANNKSIYWNLLEIFTLEIDCKFCMFI